MAQNITLEVAKLAKKKGWDQHAWRNAYADAENRAYYPEYTDGSGEVILRHPLFNLHHVIAMAPTQSVLQKWLREVHFIHINVYPNSDNEGDESIKWYYSYILRYDNALHDDSFSCFSDEVFVSYEQALEKALEVTLDLIEEV